MYTFKGKDSYGLTIWWCIRGTSSIEGLHGMTNKLFKGGHYSRALAQVCQLSLLE
jgi:hypothetical protein